MKQNFDENRKLFKKLLLRGKQQNAVKVGESRFEKCLGQQDAAPIPVGRLKIEAVYTDGMTEVLHEDKNMIVQQAEGLMAYMSIGLRSINYIELGDPSPPKAPDLLDTSLQQTTGERKATVNSVSGKTAIHEALWLGTEANGYDFTEAGLYTDPFGTGVLFARKTFEPITKLASFSLKFTWAISYSVREHNDGCSGVSLMGSSSVVEDYVYISPVGGETEVIVPIDFTPGTKQLDVFLRGQRLVYNRAYYESTIGASSKGIILIGFSLNKDDVVYFVNRKLA